MSKTTPGPWQVVPQDMDTGEKWFDIWSPTYGSIAHVSENARSDEGMQFFQGDARLIAAAPALLEACKTVLAYLQAGSPVIGYTKVYDLLVEALATAEGREPPATRSKNGT